MSTNLQDEIRQTRPFGSPEQEAHLSLGRTWAMLDRAFTEALRPYGITGTQYNVLRILRGAGATGLCRGAVMERMIAPVPDGTRLLDRMEAAGLIVRQRSAEDRRFVTARITERGLTLLDEVDGLVEGLHLQHMGGLGEARLHSLIETLAEVRSTL
jgi:DNA-binding MarR family transcriptional regulator